MKETCYIDSPLGTLKLIAEDNFLCGLYLCQINIEATKNPISKIFDSAKEQLNEYFEGKRKIFDLPIKLNGTEFQKSVWQQLLKIPYGTTQTYGEIANQLNRAEAIRAVGGANNKNPLMIIVPCHRVVSANGIGGYFYDLKIKNFLLELEKNNL